MRLYIHLILSCKMDSFASVFATVCSSWVHMNMFTSCRTLLIPEGDESKLYIREANMMMSRFLDQWYIYMYVWLPLVKWSNFIQLCSSQTTQNHPGAFCWWDLSQHVEEAGCSSNPALLLWENSVVCNGFADKSKLPSWFDESAPSDQFES